MRSFFFIYRYFSEHVFISTIEMNIFVSSTFMRFTDICSLTYLFNTTSVCYLIRSRSLSLFDNFMCYFTYLEFYLYDLLF